MMSCIVVLADAQTLLLESTSHSKMRWQLCKRLSRRCDVLGRAQLSLDSHDHNIVDPLQLRQDTEAQLQTRLEFEQRAERIKKDRHHTLVKLKKVCLLRPVQGVPVARMRSC